MIHASVVDTVAANDPADVISLLSLALNVAQTCFLAWLAVYARHATDSSSTPGPPHP
jgi:hypothetical protein